MRSWRVRPLQRSGLGCAWGGGSLEGMRMEIWGWECGDQLLGCIGALEAWGWEVSARVGGRRHPACLPSWERTESWGVISVLGAREGRAPGWVAWWVRPS